MVSVTLTDSVLHEAGEGSWVDLLSVAHHPEPTYIGRHHVIVQGVVVGRTGGLFGSGCLDRRRLSRRHARFNVTGDLVTIEDLGSRNGTTVNGEPVAKGELSDGDLIQLGDVTLVYHRAPADACAPTNERLLGVSWQLGEVLNQLATVAPLDTPVLLLGETGTGKEVSAQELHRFSGRPGPMVSVNIGAVVATLGQSELFGHERGAFSGAERKRTGLVQEAHTGTLFLDEIGDASPEIQAALLRVIQEGQVRPVGGNVPRAVDVRFISATHRDIPAEVAAGRFRRDLWERLSAWSIRIPPLRERRIDVAILLRDFLSSCSPTARLHPSVALMLLMHPWPGNVRELKALVARLVASHRGDAPLKAPSWLHDELAARVRSTMTADSASPVAPSKPSQDRAESHRRPIPSKESLEECLGRHQGNLRRAATELGVARSTAYRWFSKRGVDLERVRSVDAPPGEGDS